MTMTIDTQRLRDERRARAWTQEHLAEVSDLGLRTIQRIEKTGSASPESVRALASCFGLNASELLVDTSQTRKSTNGHIKLRPALAMAAVALLAIFSFSTTRLAAAKDVTLSFNAVITAQDDRYEHVGEMQLDDGEESQFQMNGVFKVLVTPRVLGDSQVLIALKIFTVNNGAYELASEPSLITKSGNEAAFSLDLNDDSGSRIRVTVMPTL